MISTPPTTDEARSHGQLPSMEPRPRYDDPIVIGLVNNMPDSALLSTERQFRELLSAASQNAPVRLRLFSLSEPFRTETGKLYISQHYEHISELWRTRLDGLIVTGAEPRAQALPDEPYWSSLARLVDWAEEGGISTVWSCLAAHAAVLHMDGIDRRPFGEKLSGVFECVTAEDHKILAGAPTRWRVPHSRYNDLPEEALVAKGYRILSRSPEAGVDIFIKQRKSLSIFLQGHPEYDRGALLREYRRDIGRFLAGERDSYPAMPRGYFDEDAAATFAAFRARTEPSRCIDLLSGFPAAEAEKRLVHHWRDLSVHMYANWLSCLHGAATSKVA
jgi:homoserine O-succinyltransferase